MASGSYIKGKSKEDNLAELPRTAQVGSSIHDQQRMAIFVRCAQDLEVTAFELTNVIAKAGSTIDRRGRVDGCDPARRECDPRRI
jgi:hypothetical protein